MFTGMCTLQILVLSNLSKLTICSCILFICLSLTFFLFQWQLKICILCGFIGHLHWTCHQRGCFRCGCPGHMTRDCTEPSFSKWHPCFRCGMQGHNKKVMVFCASVYEIVFLLKEDLQHKTIFFFLIDIMKIHKGKQDNNQNKFVSLPYQILTINFIIIKILQFHCRLAQSNGDSII